VLSTGVLKHSECGSRLDFMKKAGELFKPGQEDFVIAQIGGHRCNPAQLLCRAMTSIPILLPADSSEGSRSDNSLRNRICNLHCTPSP
jgi:hypothetical protein